MPTLRAAGLIPRPSCTAAKKRTPATESDRSPIGRPPSEKALQRPIEPRGRSTKRRFRPLDRSLPAEGGSRRPGEPTDRGFWWISSGPRWGDPARSLHGYLFDPSIAHQQETAPDQRKRESGAFVIFPSATEARIDDPVMTTLPGDVHFNRALECHISCQGS